MAKLSIRMNFEVVSEDLTAEEIKTVENSVSRLGEHLEAQLRDSIQRVCPHIKIKFLQDEAGDEWKSE
jgi:hypothetical protein